MNGYSIEITNNRYQEISIGFYVAGKQATHQQYQWLRQAYMGPQTNSRKIRHQAFRTGFEHHSQRSNGCHEYNAVTHRLLHLNR
jgi:hypothetical protein